MFFKEREGEGGGEGGREGGKDCGSEAAKEGEKEVETLSYKRMRPSATSVCSRRNLPGADRIWYSGSHQDCQNAGKLVMMAQGFYMVVLLSSYTANLASALTVSAIQPLFTGWELGESPVVPDNIGANIAIPDGGAEETFLAVQAARYQRDFDNVHTFDSIEESLDSVLCGSDDLMFHDESMILYYLNNEMVDFGNGLYTSDVCNMSQVDLPAGQDPRCALMLSELTRVFDVSCCST